MVRAPDVKRTAALSDISLDKLDQSAPSCLGLPPTAELAIILAN